MDNTTATGSLPARASTFQPAIQGLRAVAVGLVLIFHAFPQTLSGGFVGVDVFFVISGYLISGLLLRELDSTGTISLRLFYARRLRRLLPAALVVLVLIVLTAHLLPQARVIDTAKGVMASALSVENWRLVAHATDYLAADNAPSPTQHYWSLSVEEQFYLFWPALMLAVTWTFSRWSAKSSAKAIGAAFSVLTVLSLGYAIWLTEHSRSTAYFDSVARVWELGIGGVLAVLQVRTVPSQRIAQVVGVMGIAAIMWAAVTFSGSTAFPGPWALLPVVGSAMVLFAVNARGGLVNQVLGSRPFKFIGDISYSLYLYHWPLIVYFKARSGAQLSLAEGITLIAVSIVLAYLSKRFVEDAFRLTTSSRTRRPLRTYPVAMACVALTLGGALLVETRATGAAIATLNGAAAAVGSQSYPGAMALLSGVKVEGTSPYLPSASAAPFDRSVAYTTNCIAKFGDESAKECQYPSKHSKKTVVLIGDSHALEWLPVFSRIAVQRDWNFIVITKVSCPFAKVTVTTKDGQPFDECAKWSQNAERRVLELRPDLVITTESRRYDPFGIPKLSAGATQALAEGIAIRWRSFLSVGARVVAIADTPRMNVVVPDCMSRPGATVQECSTSRAEALALADPIIVAAKEVKQVKILDLTNGICDRSECAPVVGNVLVWMDSNHLTATYAMTLRGEIEHQLDAR